ncbi:MAG: c-type cytochrome [Planctomycetota bacterium]|nr:c-type cytochrome [Planctomycetota bacterium]
MRESPTTVEGRSKSDYAVVIMISAVSIAFLSWFIYELILGFATPSDKLSGQELFNAYGCTSCHRMDGASSGRGPNLAEFSKYAAQRAAQRKNITGKPYTTADYTVESLVEPDAYIVDKYTQGIMRVPGGVTGVQLARLTAFLLKKKEGDNEIRAAIKRFMPGAVLPEPKDGGWPADRGDAAKGKIVFNSSKTACTRCHSVVKGQGLDLPGPNLHDAGVNNPAYLYESITDPNKVILKTHQTLLVFNSNFNLEGRITILRWPAKEPGLLKVQTQNSDKELPFRHLHITDEAPIAKDKTNHLTRHKNVKGALPEAILDTIVEDETNMVFGIQISKQSLMPNFKGILKNNEIEDLVRYLLSLKKPGK